VKPARWPLDDVRATRMLRLDTRLDVLHEGLIGDLVHALSPGDLLVVNDAATLPASLRAVFDRGALEVRLLGPGSSAKGWRAVTFGPGDWRTRTEDRPSPPSLSPGDVLAIGALRATVRDGDDATPRLVTLDFDLEGAALWCALYQEGQPVQYAYVDRPLALWHVQTAYAARP
jgi:S-adenosylmethionine:tRNA ribosyltransferase-isomerase